MGRKEGKRREQMTEGNGRKGKEWKRKKTKRDKKWTVIVEG